MKYFFIFYFFLFFAGVGNAEKDLTSKVELEFEPSPDARSMQVEIRQGDQVIASKESTDPAFVIELAPGKYQVKTRARDRRGVFGEWSPPEEVQVDAPGLLLKPEHGRSKSMDPKNPYESLVLSWPDMPMAVAYLLKIKTEDGKVFVEKRVATNKIEVSLVPGQYLYNVQVEYAGALISPPSPFEPVIVIKGSEIPAPHIIWKTNKRGEQIATWNIPLGIKVKIKLEYSAFLSNEWITVQENFDKPELKISELRPPGKYRLSMLAEATGWKSSPPNVEEFEVKPVEPELDY